MNKIIKKIRYYTVLILVSLLDLIVLKRKNSFSFVVGRGNIFSGNIKASFDYFYKNFSGELSLLAHSSSNLSLCENEYIDSVIKTNSLRGLLTLLRTRFIIVEYASCDWFWPGLVPSRHLFVNLWHGIPIKKIGLSEKKSLFSSKESRYLDIIIASSHIDRAMMSSCFGVQYNNVLLIGYPRNDWLISKRVDYTFSRLNDLEQKVLNIKKGRKLILYAPTFRGHFDSKDNVDNGLYCFSEKELFDLRRILIANNAILGIRPHLNKLVDSRIPYDDVIIDMSSENINDVQMLLRNTDVLISDYSGIWVDYLLMDRPIIGFVHDWNQYQIGRGFLYDYKTIFPGALVETSAELFTTIKDIFSERESLDVVAKRGIIRKIFHFYTDGNACERLYKDLIRRIQV